MPPNGALSFLAEAQEREFSTFFLRSNNSSPSNLSLRDLRNRTDAEFLIDFVALRKGVGGKFLGREKPTDLTFKDLF
jgi:hypothetical protein